MRDERGEVKPKAMREIHARCVKISRIEAQDGRVGGKNRIKQSESHPRTVGSRFAFGVNRAVSGGSFRVRHRKKQSTG
jgi:hypothetical protein